jgi:hypothetical protein
MTISQFLQGWGAIIIAFIALVQPLLVWTYRRLFLQGNVVITERVRPEIGFAVLGPTIGLAGVMLCEKQTAFVTELRAVVTRIGDGSKHTFSWQFERTETIDEKGTKVISSLAMPFLFPSDSTRSYDELMTEAAVSGEFRKVQSQLVNDWRAYVVESVGGVEKLTLPEVQASIPQVSQAIFPAFMQTPAYQVTSAALDRLFYWQADEYRLRFEVQIRGRENPIAKMWRFRLTAEDEQSLRANIYIAQRAICEQPTSQFMFAYPEYLPAIATDQD